MGAGAGQVNRRPRRTALIAVCVAVALAAATVIAYRVFAPAEVVTPVVRALPPPAQAPPGVTSRLGAAPLIVDGRLRVYATTRQIRADGPVDARTQRSPYWSYRRWPEQVTGVVVVGRTVVGRWSDGDLVAVDARTGRVAWRAPGPPPPADTYAGRRTGAAVVYAPDRLMTTRGTVLAGGAGRWAAFDSATGRRLWRTDDAGASERHCPADAFTTAAGLLAVVDGCAELPAVALLDARSGRPVARWLPPGTAGDISAVEPLGCRIARSECTGMRVTVGGRTSGWGLRAAAPTPAPALDATGSWLVEAPGVGDVAVAAAPDGRLVARPAGGTAALWTWLPGSADPAGRARVLAAQPGRLHLLTSGYALITVDAATGAELSRFRFTYRREPVGWTPGFAYAEAGFVLVERLAPGVDADAPDDEYYFRREPVLLAAT